MINFEKQAQQIFDMIVSSPVVSTAETVKRVEDRIRKIANVERMSGYMERKREEDKLHEVLKGELTAAKEKIARNTQTWSDK